MHVLGVPPHMYRPGVRACLPLWNDEVSMCWVGKASSLFTGLIQYCCIQVF